MKTLCIYHASCADGFGAAWVVRKALGVDNVDFHPGKYGEPAPEVEGRDVILVDFSYKRDQLLQLAQSARSLLIIDHHKSAAEDLADIPEAPRDWNRWLESQLPIGAVFDMNRSGAGLTWDYFFLGQPRPRLINHIEDRDLWRFALPGTKDVMAAVFSYEQDFHIWDSLMKRVLLELRDDGHAISRAHSKNVTDLVRNARRLTIGGHEVPALNCPHYMASEAGHILDQGEPFAACYFDTPQGRVFSLRSSDQGLDVSEIAKVYGGGGHRNAAGFTVPFDHELVTGFLPATLESTHTAALHEMPDGYVLMPQALTAENGAKGLLLGEFHVAAERTCDECACAEPDPSCNVCGGEVEYTQLIAVPWDTIKEIYAKAVAGVALRTEVPQP